MILAGDIGATKTVLALFDGKDTGAPVALETYPSREHATFGELLDAFVAGPAQGNAIDKACIGVAGPVKNGRCDTTNLPWKLDAVELAQHLKIPKAALLNDLEALGWGISVLKPADVVELNPKAQVVDGNRAVIAAGTGLGQAGLYWDGAHHRPFATEGGHTDFAPQSELELGLLAHLLSKFDHVSWERIVSGLGFENLYGYLKSTGRWPESPELAAALKGHDVGAVVSEFAQAKKSELAEQTMALFFTLLGAQAGNLALTVNATGGVYLGGGIAPKNLERVRSGGLMKAFTRKGRMGVLVEAMPVRLILDQRAGLKGSAYFASIH